MASWYGLLDPTTPGGMQGAGLFSGLGALGAGLMQAGQMRPVGQPGPTIADAFNAFGAGRQQGLMGARNARNMSAMGAWDEAFSPDANPDTMNPQAKALRDTVPENMRGLIGALPDDARTQVVSQLLTRKTNPKDNLQVVGRFIYDVSSGKPVMVQEAPDTVSAERHAQVLRERAAGASRVAVTMPVAETEFEKNYGKGLAGQALDVLTQADKATGTQNTIARMQELLPQITAGRFGPAATSITSFAEALGVSPQYLKGLGLPESAKANELFEMLSNKLTASNIGGEGGVPAANFSNADMQFIRQMEANLSRRPGTIATALKARQKVAERTVEAANSWNEARANRVPFDKWQAQWRQYVNANPLFGGSEWRETTPTGSGGGGRSTMGPGGVGTAEPPPGAALPRVTTVDEYARLPSGTQFIAPDGTERRKP